MERDRNYWEAAVIFLGKEDGAIIVYFLSKDTPSWRLGINLLNIEKARIKHGHYCGGRISVKQISDSHKIIFCSECGLRRKFPADIQSLESFKQYFEKNLK